MTIRNMKNHDIEMFDIALSQAIEEYLEMESLGAAKEAAMNQWPEQTAVLIMEFLEKAAGQESEDMYEIVPIKRAKGFTFFYDLIPF